MTAYLISRKSKGCGPSKWAEHRNTLSRWYGVAYPGLALKSLSLSKVASSLNSKRSRKWTTSFNNGQVFQFLARQLGGRGAASDDETSRMLRTRDALMFALSIDLCARGDDLAGIWLREECLLATDDKGRNLRFVTTDALSRREREEDKKSRCHKHSVNLDALVNAKCLDVRMLFTKDKSTSISSVVRITRIRGKHVKYSKDKDTFTLLLRYLELTAHLRDECDGQQLFIGVCAKQARFSSTTCGGMCAKYHNLTSNTINSRRTSILEQAGIDTSIYTSHAIRGNAESAIIYAAMHGASFSEREALIRARHKMETHLKSHTRPAEHAFQLQSLGASP
jgi:hypothetical protein